MSLVTLVANEKAIRNYFPLSDKVIASADFPIDPKHCTTKLGCWLAEKIQTTKFDDDASICQICLPQTTMDFRIASICQSMQQGNIHNLEQLNQRIDLFQRRISEAYEFVKAFGKCEFAYCVQEFKWPIFSGDIHNSPEDYFDKCAKQIRETNGIIISCGFDNEMPPESITRTMNGGNGLMLLENYLKQKTFCGESNVS